MIRQISYCILFLSLTITTQAADFLLSCFCEDEACFFSLPSPIACREALKKTEPEFYANLIPLQTKFYQTKKLLALVKCNDTPQEGLMLINPSEIDSQINGLLAPEAPNIESLQTAGRLMLTLANYNNLHKTIEPSQIRTLLDQGADINAQDKKTNKTPLMWILRRLQLHINAYGREDARVQQYLEVAGVILESPDLDVRKRDNKGQTALEYAATLPDTAIHSALLSAQTSLESHTEENQTSMDIAHPCSGEEEHTSDISQDFSFTCQCCNKRCCLTIHAHAFCKHLKRTEPNLYARLRELTTKFLATQNLLALVEFADDNTPENWKIAIPLKIMSQPENLFESKDHTKESLERLITLAYDVKTYHDLRKTIEPSQIRTLLDQGADINAQDEEENKTPLMWILRRLQLHINADGREDARVQQHLAAARIMLDAPALDVHKQDKKGCAALHYAAMLPDPAICSLLLDAKASLDARTEENQTPLEIARLRSGEEGAVFKFLSEYAQQDLSDC